MKNGALGGKLLGAGGGGFFLFYVPKEKQNIFRKYLKKTIIIPFNFTNEGSEIMFNKHDDKII
jgi:D-glycero-alpha-D-manno-heptose-7-phosphate kinase